MDYELEIQRNNISLSNFFSIIRKKCKEKGIYFEIDIKEFKNPEQENNNRYIIKDGQKIAYNNGYKNTWEAEDNGMEAEIYITLPLKYQTYFKMTDGTIFNEICEYEPWDEKTGTGYFYAISKTPSK